jgi:hypothetical protein
MEKNMQEYGSKVVFAFFWTSQKKDEKHRIIIIINTEDHICLLSLPLL